MQHRLLLQDKAKLIKTRQLDTKMPHIAHILQPKHSLLKQKEVEDILEKYNVSISQLPKIKITDPALPEGANVGDVIKIERKDDSGTHHYFRVVII